MTMNQAIRRIRKHAPETEATFRAICRNRYSRPVRKWAIYDLSKLHKIMQHIRLKNRFFVVFHVSQVAYIWRDVFFFAKNPSDSTSQPTPKNYNNSLKGEKQ